VDPLPLQLSQLFFEGLWNVVQPSQSIDVPSSGNPAPLTVDPNAISSKKLEALVVVMRAKGGTIFYDLAPPAAGVSLEDVAPLVLFDRDQQALKFIPQSGWNGSLGYVFATAANVSLAYAVWGVIGSKRGGG